MNVNVWKGHQTLQSVFNRGECMMNVDQNEDRHVVDQNVDRILGRLPTYLLVKGSGPNVVHAFRVLF